MSATIRYTGSAEFASMLASDLRDAGLEVDYTPPMEQRRLRDVAEAYVFVMTIVGTADTIKMVGGPIIEQFRKRWPKAKVEVDWRDGRGYR